MNRWGAGLGSVAGFARRGGHRCRSDPEATPARPGPRSRRYRGKRPRARAQAGRRAGGIAPRRGRGAQGECQLGRPAPPRLRPPEHGVWRPRVKRSRAARRGARAELGSARSRAGGRARTCEFGGLAGASVPVRVRACPPARGAASRRGRAESCLPPGDVAQPNLNNNRALEKGGCTLRSFPTKSEPFS